MNVGLSWVLRRPIETTTLTQHADSLTVRRVVYVLRAGDADGNEMLMSTAFWLKDVGIVTADHAVRDEDGNLYPDLRVFREGFGIDDQKVKVMRLSEHHDLAILLPLRKKNL